MIRGSDVRVKGWRDGRQGVEIGMCFYDFFPYIINFLKLIHSTLFALVFHRISKTLLMDKVG